MIWILVTYAILSTLFGTYIIAVSMNGARERRGLHWLEWFLGGPWLLFFVLAELLAQIILSIIWADPPQAWTVTERLARWKTEGGIKAKVATVVCRILSKYDPDGTHC